MEQEQTRKINSIRGAITRKRNEIKSLANSSGGVRRRDMMEAEHELEKLIKEDGMHWIQRSREDWIKWGDRNTKWFTSHRRKINMIMIMRLLDNDDHMISGQIRKNILAELLRPIFKICYSQQSKPCRCKYILGGNLDDNLPLTEQ